MNYYSIKRRMGMLLVNHFLAGTHYFSAKRRILRSIGYEIGDRTKIVGPISCTGRLLIGEDCWIGRNLTVEGNGSVEIGNNVDIGPNVAFLTGGHVIGSRERRAGAGETYCISVGSGAWIGANSTLCNNIHIADGCVIAACACVVRDTPSNIMVGGVPATKIKDLN